MEKKILVPCIIINADTADYFLQQSCSSLNLKLCSLCNRLQCGSLSTKKYMNRLVKNSHELDSIGANIDVVLSSLTPGNLILLNFYVFYVFLYSYILRASWRKLNLY